MNNETITCNGCKKTFNIEDTVNYGIFRLCRKCDKYYQQFNKPKNEPELHVMAPPISTSAAFYNVENSNIFIVDIEDKEHEIKDIVESISHETIHYVIHKLQGIRACYGYDYYSHNPAIYSCYPQIAYGVTDINE